MQCQLAAILFRSSPPLPPPSCRHGQRGCPLDLQYLIADRYLQPVAHDAKLAMLSEIRHIPDYMGTEWGWRALERSPVLMLPLTMVKLMKMPPMVTPYMFTFIECAHDKPGIQCCHAILESFQ